MFCPKCATQNNEGQSFCRACGANISLVPQALNGQLPANEPDESSSPSSTRRGRKGREVTLDSAFRNMFMGVAFLIIAIALSRSIGATWWFWMLIPAFLMMGSGVAQYLRLKESERKASLGRPTFPDRGGDAPSRGLPPRNTGELVPPPASVTEGTTRHLGVEAATRHLDKK